MDCFICCTRHGKTDAELCMTAMNSAVYDGAYPLIPLSDAFLCSCTTTFAHNRCLIKVDKCPTCRKMVPWKYLQIKSRFGVCRYLIAHNKVFYGCLYAILGLAAGAFGLGILQEHKYISVNESYLKCSIVAVYVLFMWFASLTEYVKKNYLFCLITNKYLYK